MAFADLHPRLAECCRKLLRRTMLILGGPAILSSSSRTPEISLAGRAADGESLPVL
jgi:hypothetical protein